MNDNELLGVVDEDDNVIGQETREACHSRHLIHRSVMGFVFDKEGRVFVNQRSQMKEFFPGHYSIVYGGHTPAGQDIDEAAARELKEELGITGKPFYLDSYKKRIPEEEENVRVYGVIADKPLTLLEEEITEGEFMSPRELEEEMERKTFLPETKHLYPILKEYWRKHPPKEERDL